MNAVWMGLLNRLMSYLCGRLWDIAKQWAAIYEQKEMTGAEKRERVASLIREEARAIGVDVAENLINLAVEAAVQYLRRRAG